MSIEDFQRLLKLGLKSLIYIGYLQQSLTYVIIYFNKINLLYNWSHRLTVRTLPSQGSNQSSILCEITLFKNSLYFTKSAIIIFPICIIWLSA